ncbi:hypothetical protein IV203_026033 [Nitzschia inconspicua]|uniref:Uncharacterized protein n=1 Tax=Nitzschia inconspicua TaxID=303405 RepID=A0A9K3K717_9STRA|nr:hypothetical protein IV203_009431 [Nitzschia inconspicua]KAG7362673.1 hypothetical protein IV203_026033 [Nitzschia inconspicua]
MVEDTTRRRHHSRSVKSGISTSTSATEIGLGGPMTEDDDDNEKSYDNEPKIRPSIASKTTTTVTSPSHRQGRLKKRRRRNENDPPFVVLFLQVGTVLLLLCLVSYYIYRSITHSYAGQSLDEQQYLLSSEEEGAEGDLYEIESSPDEEILAVEGESSSEDDGMNAIDDPSPIDDGMSPEEKQHRLDQAQKLSDLLQEGDKIIEQSSQQQQQQQQRRKLEVTDKPTPPPLPVFDLSPSSHWDAFGSFKTLHSSQNLQVAQQQQQQQQHDQSAFWNASVQFQQQYALLYGGENAARMLLDRGLTTFSTGGEVPSDIVATACRFHEAKREQRPFVMAFGGYSVTTGRGNRHQDSYPFQLQRILEPLLQTAGIPSLQVHNAAIGGCPSFPYGWCMKEFFGDSRRGNATTSSNVTISTPPDVVSWDFGMNEATGGSEGLEAYVRQLLATYSYNLHGPREGTISAPPKLIVKDHSTAKFRQQLLSEYAALLRDPVVIHTDNAVQPFLDRDEEYRPIGFQKWREFGAPHGAPGQAAHHPAVKEHKLNGWMLAMHFVTALHYMMSMNDTKGNWCFQSDRLRATESFRPTLLPPPVSHKIMNDTNIQYDSFLFGRSAETGETTNKQQSWVVDPIHCRTTFQPKLSGDLSEIVASGTEAEDLEVTLPKSQMYYNKGWTFDLSASEKSAKRKLNLYPNGLGFQDSKEAYYGIYESGRMSLLLPYEESESAGTLQRPMVSNPAIDWFQSVIVCQVNEKTFEEHPDACNFATDVSFDIGGVNVTSNTTKMIHTIGSVYLGKPICKHIPVPAGATLTSHNQLLSEDEKATESLEIDQVGLLVEIFVSNPHIVHIEQACSVSHVIWQEQGHRKANNGWKVDTR